MRQAQVLVFLVLPVLVAGLSADCQAAGAGGKETDGMRRFRFGFRHDPMKFIQGVRSLEGATVRAFVLKDPKPGDEQLLAKKVEEILEKQAPDGALSDHPLHAVMLTGRQIIQLVELGVSREDPRFRRAVEYVRRHGGKDKGDKETGIDTARALYLGGAADTSVVRDAVRREIDQADRWIHTWCGCPWTPASQMRKLWGLSELDDRVRATVVRGLKEIAGKLNEAGCADFNDPWGYLDMAGHVNHPLAKQIVEKQIPMVVRSQRKDGGWGQHSAKVFRALKRFDLLDELRKLPPLPPDFKITHFIPAPGGDLFTMTWGNGRLWIYDRKDNQAIAVSPETGEVMKRLALPVKNARGIGWWEGALAVTQQNPEQKTWEKNTPSRTLFQIAPASGAIKKRMPLHKMHNIWAVAEVTGRLVIADGFLNAVGIFDPKNPAQPGFCVLGAPGTIHLAAHNGAVWHTDWLLTSIIFKSDPSTRPQGRLLDWGTAPFEGSDGDWEDQMAIRGLACDGERLWALDGKGSRICVIEKMASPARE